MRIAKTFAAAAVAATVWTGPSATEEWTNITGYLTDGVKWQGFDSATKGFYLMGVWDGYTRTLVVKRLSSPQDYHLLKCTNERNYQNTDLVTIVDQYYARTNDLKVSPANALFMGLIDLCVPKKAKSSQ